MSTDLRSVHFAEIRSRLTGNRLEVYAAMLEHGPATAKELAERMGWDKCSVRPRLTELRDAFHVVETGERRNSEHVFAALSVAEAEQAFAVAKAQAAPPPAPPVASTPPPPASAEPHRQLAFL